MFVRNCWYVVAWTTEIEGDALMERTVLGESLLVYRSSTGEPVVLDNRCAHRHAPLSRGRRTGDEVRCMYHGLKFDAQGRCVEVPGQTSIAEGMRVRRYPAVQRGTWIWVWMGEADKADESLIPDAFSLDHPEWRYRPGGYLRWEIPYLLICDNLLDFAHLSYVHESSLGGSTSIAETRPRVESIPRGVRVKREVRRTVPAPYHRMFGQFDGDVDRLFDYQFVLPGVLLMYASVKPSGTPDDDLQGALRMHGCQALTPETEHSTHYFFMQAHAFRLDDPAVSEALYQLPFKVFEEDRSIIAAQADLIQRSVPKPMQPLPADAALGRFRHLVTQMLEAERTALDAPSTSPGRRPV